MFISNILFLSFPLASLQHHGQELVFALFEQESTLFGQRGQSASSTFSLLLHLFHVNVCVNRNSAFFHLHQIDSESGRFCFGYVFILCEARELDRPTLSGYRRGELSSVFGDGRLLGHGSLSKLGKNATLFDMDDMDRQWEMEFFMGMGKD